MITLFYISLFLFLFLSVILCFAILIQEAKSLGLGASFGGDNSDSLFGTSTAEVLKKFTAYVSGAYLVICLSLSLWTSALGRHEAAALIRAPIESEQTTQETAP